MPRPALRTVAKLRQLAACAVTVLVFGYGGAASAEGWRLIHPELGLGGGALSLGEISGPVMQLDLNGGASKPLGVGEAGLMLRLDLLFTGADQPVDLLRFDVAPLFTYALKAPGLKGLDGLFPPTARLGVGPLFTSLQFNEREATPGLGFSGELSLGLEGLIDVYLDARSSTDAMGASLGATAGLRLNALLVLMIMGGG